MADNTPRKRARKSKRLFEKKRLEKQMNYIHRNNNKHIKPVQKKNVSKRCLKGQLNKKLNEEPLVLMTKYPKTFQKNSTVMTTSSVARNPVIMHTSCNDTNDHNSSSTENDSIRTTSPVVMTSNIPENETPESVIMTTLNIDVCEPLVLSVIDSGYLMDIKDDKVSPDDVKKRRYPKRSGVEKKKYIEEDLLDEDEFLCCEQCKQIHHRNVCVDNPLSRLTLTPFNGDITTVQYNAMPLPGELTLKPSTCDTGVGIFAVQPIPEGVRFGPYKGRKIYEKDLTDDMDTSYMWEVKQDGESYFIDGQLESESNWLRYINCARNEEEQNLVAFQYKGNIYYRSMKNIKPDNELLVSYEDQSANDDLTISLVADKQDNKSNEELVTTSCNDSFVSHSSLDTLLQSIHQNKSYNEAISPVLTHSEHVMHQSDSCDETNLRTHQKCQINGNDLRILRRHKKRAGVRADFVDKKESIDPEKTCSHCGKECDSKKGLQRHIILMHDRKNVYKCCGRRFSQKASFNLHVLSHTVNKNAECDDCGKRFARYDQVLKHKYWHTGDNLYKCHYCKIRFKDKNSLKIHLRSHFGDRPYKCPHCGRDFTRNDNLRRHIRGHTTTTTTTSTGSITETSTAINSSPTSSSATE